MIGSPLDVPAPMVTSGMVTIGDAKVTGPYENVIVGVSVVTPLGWTISCEAGVPLTVTPDGPIMIWAIKPPGPTLSVMPSMFMTIWVAMPSGPTLSVMLEVSILIWVRGDPTGPTLIVAVCTALR